MYINVKVKNPSKKTQKAVVFKIVIFIMKQMIYPLLLCCGPVFYYILIKKIIYFLIYKSQTAVKVKLLTQRSMSSINTSSLTFEFVHWQPEKIKKCLRAQTKNESILFFIVLHNVPLTARRDCSFMIINLFWNYLLSNI